ncbi:MAG: hypothetical protein K6L73_08430 [Cellvibrionaceae bacterium]
MKYPPNIGKLPSRALARLLRAERLTHLTFQHEASTYRLAACIERLRNKYQWPITSQRRTSKTNDPTGRNATFCVYFLEIPNISKAGKRGKEYSLKVFEWEKRRREKEAATSLSLSQTTDIRSKTKKNITTLKDGGTEDG